MNQIAGEDTSLALVQRSLRDREIAQGLARAAVLKRRYDAPVADVWSAITTPERIDRFFLPLRGDLREGGTYAFEGQASGRILVCDAPRLLRVEWVPPGCRDDGDQVEVRLTADGPNATWLELEHASVADVFHFDPEAGTYSPALGWEAPLHYLGEYLRGVLPDRPGVEWHEFDEAEEMRLATFRAPEWAKAEARYHATR
ncbi:SRPBCC domain-containing protein [Pseudonocardia humida]|uniref:SRPBCC domain-containing protein n=1 Tax=Pseudonocardia humida TaxID=2800819 RepID=A0ABT1A0M8_9PSEU|nr:SRPBCC domain-containing protein [Pseudonocardia humida]MCO1656465.1 SRPBCC domain-containing protein [Pseudonocardia humida]